MPYDVGVTASRNQLLREVAEDYFILCDDDFVLGAKTSFQDALEIFDAEPNIGVIGGRLYDFDGEHELIRNWELFLYYDQSQKLLFSIPIYEAAPRARELCGIRYFLCDAVMNFAIFRRSIFSSEIKWDERFKSNGEHEDFFLNLKLNSSVKVAYLPTLEAYHHHPEVYTVYRSRLRERNEGWKLFFEKWGVEQHIELGLGIRTLDNVGVVTATADARARFFVNPDLSLARERSDAAAIVLGDYTNISAIGALNEQGSRTSVQPVGRLLVDGQSGSIVPGPGERPDAPTPAAVRSERELIETYGLESHDGQAVATAGDELYFRYDPTLRDDAEFFLWYHCFARPARLQQQRLAVVARWWASNGANLIWRSRRMFLNLAASSYWRPIFVEVPVLPRGCSWLRFDLVTDGRESADPVCTGFLFSPQGEVQDAELPDALALGRLPNDGANPGGEGQVLRELGRSCRLWQIPPPKLPPNTTASMLDLEHLSGLEALYLVGWEDLGRSLISARLPTVSLPMPSVLTLPRKGCSSGAARIFGYGQTAGFVALSW
jgi:hypothetical protein